MVYVRRTPHPVIVTRRDNKGYIRVLFYSYYATITGWGVPPKVYEEMFMWPLRRRVCKNNRARLRAVLFKSCRYHLYYSWPWHWKD